MHCKPLGLLATLTALTAVRALYWLINEKSVWTSYFICFHAEKDPGLKFRAIKCMGLHFVLCSPKKADNRAL